MEKVKRTNVRLPKTVHDALKKAAIDRESTIEQIVLAAVERELGCNIRSGILRAANRDLLHETAESFKTLAGRIEELLNQPLSRDEELLNKLAYRFVQYVPSSIIIKRLNGKIEWCNRTCELLFGARLEAIKDKTTDEVLGIERRSDVLAHLQEVVEHGRFSAVETFEFGADRRYFLTHRFIFSDERGPWIGDISIPFEDWQRASAGTFCKPVYKNDEFHEPQPPQMSGLLARFLDRLPTAAALKDLSQSIQWCNEDYWSLAGGSSAADIIGKTVADAFRLPPDHPVLLHDRQVAECRIAVIAEESLPEHPTRTSIRFPIYENNGAVEFIGTVSTDLRA